MDTAHQMALPHYNYYRIRSVSVLTLHTAGPLDPHIPRHERSYLSLPARSGEELALRSCVVPQPVRFTVLVFLTAQQVTPNPGSEICPDDDLNPDQAAL